MSKTEFIVQDIQLAYARCIEGIFNCWTHDDDGGCNYEATGQRQVFTMNNLTVIFQPVDPNDGWAEDGVIIMTPTKESGIKLTKTMFTKAKPLLDIVEEKLVDSYNSFVSKYKFWYDANSKEKLTFKDMTSMITPIFLDESSSTPKIRFKWHLKCTYDSFRWWNPVELINWKQSLAAYKRYRVQKETKNIDTLKKTLENTILEKEKLLLIPEESFNVIDEANLKSADVNIDNLNKVIDYYQKKLLEDEPAETAYIHEDEEYLTAWIEEEGYGSCKHRKETYGNKVPVSHEEAFPDRPKAGKKRSRE
jgi:hypothetical protein